MYKFYLNLKNQTQIIQHYHLLLIFALINFGIHFVARHRFGVDIGTTVCHKWIATLFIDPFHTHSPEFAYRIFDMFFVHGPNFLIRLCVALLVYKPHAGALRARSESSATAANCHTLCS